MTEQQPTDLLAALPRTRPHRRSAKRGEPSRTPGPQGKATSEPDRKAKTPPARRSPQRKPTGTARAKSRRPAGPSGARLRQPAQPAGTPTAARPPSAQARKVPPTPGEILGTAVGAAAELAEIGMTLSSRALRRALSRLPRP